MFWTSMVHLQDRSYAVCCNLVLLDMSCCYEYPHNNRTYRDVPNCNIQHKNAPEDGRTSFTLITTERIETYQIATYSIRTLLKMMDYWSPKHVELLNVMNKINHQILCILLDYIYITIHVRLSKLYNLSLAIHEKLNYDFCISSY